MQMMTLLGFCTRLFFANNTSGAEAFYCLLNVELDWVSKKTKTKQKKKTEKENGAVAFPTGLMLPST